MGGLTFEVQAKFVDDGFEELCQELLPGYEERHMEDGVVMLRRKRTAVFFSYADFHAHILKCELARLAEEQEAQEKRELEEKLTSAKNDLVNKAWTSLRQIPQYLRDVYCPRASTKSKLRELIAA